MGMPLSVEGRAKRLPGDFAAPAPCKATPARGRESSLRESFTASSPCKAILFGEHYVVYGSPALALAIEPRNTVEFSDGKGDGIALKSVLGSGRVSDGGAYAGAPELSIFAEVAKTVFGAGKAPGCTAEFLPAWKLKGVGTSASLCAAFAAGLYRLKGEKADAEKIFTAAQAGDLLAHGGRASGIDAKTVSYGKALVFQRSFSPQKFVGKPSGFSLPAGTVLLLIDTNVGKTDGTIKMLETFASQFGVQGSPAEAKEEQRQKIREEYAPLWEKIARAMAGADAKTLGFLMDENHALLKRRKMSSAGIERAVSAALAAGAYGAKLIGAGGEGGAALALFDKKGAGAAAENITAETGFACHPLSLAALGAHAD